MSAHFFFFWFLLNVVTHNITRHVRIWICVQKWTHVRNPTCLVITSTRHKLHPVQNLSIPYRWDYILITIKICYKLDKYVILCAPVLNRYVINLINNYKNMVLSNTLNHIVTKIFRDKLKQYFGNGTDNFGYLS